MYEEFNRLVENISALIPIQDLGEHIGIDFAQRARERFVGSCPFHSDSTPSFYINTDINAFNCFGCARKGSPYKLAKEWLLFSNDAKSINVKQVLTFLSQINPAVGELTWQTYRPIESDPNKKKAFELALSQAPKERKRPVYAHPEFKRRVISGIMLGYEGDNLDTYVYGASLERKKGADLYDQLLGDI